MLNNENKFSVLLNIGKIVPCIGCSERACEPEICSPLDNWVKSSMKNE